MAAILPIHKKRFAIIPYCGKRARVECDSNCKKAWGRHSRPKVQLSEDVDDFAYLADTELSVAPDDPGTYEGGDGKPTSPFAFPNAWCVRECERCKLSDYGTEPTKELVLTDFTKRVYNIPR